MFSNDSADDDDNYQRILSVPSANRFSLMYATCILKANNPPETIESNRMLYYCWIGLVYCSLWAIKAQILYMNIFNRLNLMNRMIIIINIIFGASALTKRSRIPIKSHIYRFYW